MTRVTLVTLNYAPEPTGIAPYSTGAAVGLAAQGDTVLAITGYPHYPQWRILDRYPGLTRREHSDGVRLLRLRHPVPRAGGLLTRAAMEIVFGLRAAFSPWSRPDVVIAVSPALLSSAIVVLRARLTRTPVIVWVQDIYTLGAAQTGAAGLAARTLRLLESWTTRKADRVIVIHDRFKRFLERELAVPSGRIDIVRNWTHVKPATGRSSTTRHQLGWKDDETIVLHAGAMGSKQNLENVVLASRLAAEEHSKVRFVLLGDGHRRPALQAMGANPNLQFLDPLPDGVFESALASADVLLVNELPGMTEMSVPSKLTSYFSTGLPVLAAVDETSVTAEEIQVSGGGLRVPPSDPVALLAGAQRLAEDQDLALSLGERGLAHRESVLMVDTAIAGLTRSMDDARG